MRIEAPEVKREDGSRFKVIIEISDYSYREIQWELADVLTKEPRKRTWLAHETHIRNSLQYSGIPYDERNKVVRQKLTDLVGEEEVKKAFQYAYDYIKPDILKEIF